MDRNNRLSLGKAIGSCLLNPSFKGRSRRSEFWGYTLFFVCLSCAIEWLQICIAGNATFLKVVFALVLLLIQLLASYFQLAVTFRRLHDVGKSGWWAGLLALFKILRHVIPFTNNNVIGNIILLLFMIMFLVIILGFCTKDSQKEKNEYGVSPKYDMNYVSDAVEFMDSPLGKIVNFLSLLFIIGITICFFIGIGILLSMWLCNIEPGTTYSWYSGIWHGLFFIPNLVRSWFGDTLYKAEYYTTAYNIFWWVTVIWQGLTVLSGAGRDN